MTSVPGCEDICIIHRTSSLCSNNRSRPRVTKAYTKLSLL